MSLQAPLEPFGSCIILVVQGLADGFQSLCPVSGQPQGHEVRMLRSFVRFSGPEGDVIEGKMLVDMIAVYHGAQATVAHRKSFLEEGGRTVVMQGQVSQRGTRTGHHE